MRKNLFTLLIACLSLQVAAQDTRSAKTLELLISDSRNSPKSRVVAAVRQGEWYINKPGRSTKDLDSASMSLVRGKQLSKEFGLHVTDGELLFLEGLIAKNKVSREEGDRLNDLALTYLKKKPGNDFLGRALLEKGDYLNVGDDAKLMQKIALLREAIGCFADSGYAKTRAGTWKMIGDLYGIRPITPENGGAALDAYQRAMSTYFSFGYGNVQDIYIEMAINYKHLGDQQQGLNYCLLAVETAERAKDTSMTLCQIYNYTGMQYRSLMDYANAKKYFALAFDIAEKYSDTNGIFSIELNLNSAYLHEKDYRKLKQLIDRVYAQYPAKDSLNQFVSYTWYLRYFTAIKDVANGRKYASALVRLTSDTAASLLRYTGRDTYTAMSDFYGQIRDFKNAYRYWDKGYAITLAYDNSPGNKSLVLYDRYRIDSASNNWQSAAKFLKQYSEIRDSMYSANKSTQEANLRVLYDTKAKEYRLEESQQKIEMLTQNERLQQANLRQAVLMRNITISFSILVIVVSFFLFRMLVQRNAAVRKIAGSNVMLEKLVSEKEWLVKEIHHRVKNNLHTVICLLESQASYLEKDALKAVEESRNRIYTMSLIHQKLYENQEVKTINIGDFVTGLIDYLGESYNVTGRITFKLEIAPVQIDSAIAIPIGLIINEAVTNAIKYAFPKYGSGVITIRLYEKGDKVVVVVADNGVGMNLDLVDQRIPSMGIRLMKGLCADIGGKISFSGDDGTQIRLTCSPVLVNEEAVDVQQLLNNISNAI